MTIPRFLRIAQGRLFALLKMTSSDRLAITSLAYGANTAGIAYTPKNASANPISAAATTTTSA